MEFAKIKREITFRKKTLTLYISVVLAGLLFSYPTPSNAVELDELFIESPIQADMSGNPDPTIVRQRYVSVDFTLMAETDTLPVDGTSPQKELLLNLFDDVTVTALIANIVRNASGSTSWVGSLKNIALSEVVIVVNGDIMMANISFNGQNFQVRSTGGKLHLISENDQSKIPLELEPITEMPVEYLEMPLVGNSDPASTPDMLATPEAMADDGSIIKLLVAYTDDARAAAGGTIAMETLVDLAITETNTGYANSNIIQRVSLAHTAEVSYDETGFDWSTTLDRIRSHTDGYLDDVHALRDAHEADAVVFIVNDATYGGLGYFMSSVSANFASAAFSVVSVVAATGNYSFGHELGHNMGSRHDWYVDADTTPYSYSHGYVNRGASWRTVMAYNTECDDAGGYCARINYWSNPDESYLGNPTGIASGTSTTCTESNLSNPLCDADNQSSLDNTRTTVANFRQDGTGNLVTSYTQGFENFTAGYNLAEEAWYYQDINSDNYSWYIGTGGGRTGTQLARMFPATGANDWMFTKGLNLENGITYQVTFYARDINTIAESLRLAVGTVPNAANMTTVLNDWTITVASWTQYQAQFTPSSSGIHYFGWYSSANPSDGLDIDDITVAPSTFDLSVSKDGTGAGTVTSSPVGIDCGGDCTETYSYNKEVTLSASPDTGSTFTGWSGSGCNGTGSCVVTMDGAKSVTATFTINANNLTVSKDGTGTGSVTSSPAGISCGGDCSETYSYNTEVTLSASPDTGSTFTGWSGSGCGGTGSCVVTMDGVKSVTATFTINSNSLTVSKDGTGTGTVTSNPIGIDCGGDCSENYSYNTEVTLSASPDTGSSFTGWSGSGCGGTGSCVVAMDGVKSVTASFTINSNTYSLTVSKHGTGTGTVTSSPIGIDCGLDCSEVYENGTEVTLVATPEQGSRLIGWSGDLDCEDGTVTMISEVNCMANFYHFPWTIFFPSILNSVQP